MKLLESEARKMKKKKKRKTTICCFLFCLIRKKGKRRKDLVPNKSADYQQKQLNLKYRKLLHGWHISWMNL